MFDPYGDLDDYDSDDEFMNPYVSTAELISSDYKMIGVVKECLYKRAGQRCVDGFGVSKSMIESRILGEMTIALSIDIGKVAGKILEPWAKEFSEG